MHAASIGRVQATVEALSGMTSRLRQLPGHPPDDRSTVSANRNGRTIIRVSEGIGIVSAGSLCKSFCADHMADSFKSLKSQLLLDGGKLHGSFFHRAVVLICQHDPEGAFGLVLNRSSGNEVGDVIVADMADSLKTLHLYLGGPVQPQALSFLHADSFLLNANVMPNLNVSHSLDDLVELGQTFSSTQKLRVFAGYAGWSPGQLDDEMKREAWLTHPASIEWIFNKHAEELWKAILRQKGWKYRLLAETPEDASWN
jgi:putative transcriptional regulator